jgi:hypothetical protein
MRDVTLHPMRNAAGYVALRALEAVLDRRYLARLREALWARHAFLYVTPPRLLVAQALAVSPPAVRRLCREVAFVRGDARGGGAFDPARNGIWLAAGVETYEALGQARMSARHELFHFVCWNHPWYREDEERGFPRLIRALEDSRREAARYPRYATWVREAFLRQGDHANVVEYFADIPTNFPDPRELPAPLAAHFGPLLTDARPPATPAAGRGDLDLASFQRLIGPDG